MSRWIDADALKIPSEEMIAKMAIAHAPSIDIVRCGVCEYKRLYDDGETKYYYCALEDRPNRQWSVDDTDYCSWGEVRDEQMD